MKRRMELSKVFAQLRQLPPEVSFDTVESWVKSHTIPPVKKNSWWNQWLTHWKHLN